MINYYYSEKQKSSIAMCSHSPEAPVRFNLFIQGKEYTEVCSEGEKSNWSDAVLVHQQETE
jgi:hypothetical protein